MQKSAFASVAARKSPTTAKKMPMQMANILHEMSIPKPFMFLAAGVLTPPVQAYQVTNDQQAQAVGPANQVTSGAMLMCTFGMAPGVLVVTPPNQPATVHDALPVVNITPCGMCTSIANPEVAAATAAALGVLTPMPCAPCTHCWDNGSNGDTLQPSATLSCMWAGTISIVSSGS